MNVTDLQVLSLVNSILSLFGSILVYIADSLGRYKVFEKAGLKNSWGAWIPFYKDWIFLKMGNFPGILAFFPIIPLAICIAFYGPTINKDIPIEVGGVVVTTAFLTYSLLTAVVYVVSIFSSVLVGSWLQKRGYWAILYMFFPYVWFLVNGFDQSQWVSPRPKIEKFSLDDYNNYDKQAPEEHVKPGEVPVVDMTPGPALASGLAAFLPIEDPPTPPPSGKRRK